MPILPDDFERRLAERRAVVRPAAARRAAVAAVLRVDGGRHELLLMQRVEHERDPWSGQVSLPGGTAEPQDGDLLATAVRETREELGLDLRRDSRLVGRLDPLGAVARGGPLDLDITPFVFRAEAPLDIVPGPEVSAHFWLPLRPVVEGVLDDVFEWRDGPLARRLPCWRYEGRVIWGLTHRMILSLLDAAGAVEDAPGRSP